MGCNRQWPSSDAKKAAPIAVYDSHRRSVIMIANSASSSALRRNLLRCSLGMVGHLVVLFNTIVALTARLQRFAEISNDSRQLSARSSHENNAKASQFSD